MSGPARFTGENLLRELAPQVLGAVVRRFRDFAAAEDAVQEALLAAATQWPADGVPDNPRGWLIHVAARRMTDHVRAEIARRRRETAVVHETPEAVPPDVERYLDAGPEPDDTLILLFMCCHPSLTRPSAIAALHDEAPRAADTDWPQILALYGLLERMADNPMIALNRAIAAAMVHGPAHGLGLLRTLDADPRLAGHYRLDAMRAHLLEMAGRPEEAIERYRAAAGRTTSIPERDYLISRAAELSTGARRTC